ncbi:MAG: NADH-quinone oxidoreductase subunit NuoN [Coriobacteriia bacterium]
MSPYVALLPEFLLLAGALIALFGELLPGGKGSPAYLGAALSFFAAVLSPAAAGSFFAGALAYDGRTDFARAAIAALTGVYLLWLGARGPGSGRTREAASLAMFSALGGMLLVGANDLVTLYISLELSTMPAYVLIGFARKNARGLEGALKYFLLALLTSLVMAYGLSLLYGFSGTTSLEELTLANAGLTGTFVAIFVAVGFLAKLSAAPFHYWTPDAYEGATPAAVAFVSSVPKVAGLVALVRLLGAFSTGVAGLAEALWVAAAFSMLLGNLGAFPQTDIRRLMAYSGIAHTGYLLMGLAAGTEVGAAAAVFYAAAYALPSMAVMLVSAEHGTSFTELAGLASRRPLAAWGLVVFFLSLVGIPPAIGFFGKLYLFGGALGAGQTGLVVLAVLVSVASLGYYFRVVREVFFAEPEITPVAPERSLVADAVLLVCLAVTLLAGLAVSPVLDMIGLAL